MTLPTVINWEPIAGVAGYELKLEFEGAPEGRYFIQKIYNSGDELATSHNWIGTINYINSQYGKEHTWICKVRALSGDIETVANALEADASISGDYVLFETVKEEIKESINESTTDTVIDDITDVGVDNMADAMQNDEEVLDKVEELEKDYAEKNDIEVAPPVVEHPEIEDEDIKVVGSGLNAEVGKTITLAFAKVDKNDEVKVNNKLYKNTVQVNISLKEDDVNVKGELKAPITITMKPPKGVNLKKLVILHYLDDGGVESIYPKVNDDGTVTFSVTSFSTFAFANLVYFDQDGSEELSGEDTPDQPDEPDNPAIPDEPDIPNEPNIPGISVEPEPTQEELDAEHRRMIERFY